MAYLSHMHALIIVNKFKFKKKKKNAIEKILDKKLTKLQKKTLSSTFHSRPTTWHISWSTPLPFRRISCGFPAKQPNQTHETNRPSIKP
jgi:hypothetical protein